MQSIFFLKSMVWFSAINLCFVFFSYLSEVAVSFDAAQHMDISYFSDVIDFCFKEQLWILIGVIKPLLHLVDFCGFL